uniref:uncharacterized protein LOC109953685 n=1 Tax=Monopterus albus TaxID=43700 RepID=UPI0009B4A7B7|nr:uncharacterized protein LOC109953685 [Monopterus albus]
MYLIYFYLFSSDMTLPKNKNACPICMKTYAAMSKHLKASHGVLNLQERQLLLNLASNRVNIRRQACPVMGCNYNSTRLDQHIPSCHTELNEAQVQQYLQWARRATTIALLKELRSTDPAVPLASCLDLGLEEEEEERYQQGPPLEMMSHQEPQCPNADCVAQLRSWQQSAMEKGRKAEVLEEELRQLRGAYQKLAKKFNRLSKERGTEATVAVRGREEEEEKDDHEQPGPSYVPDEQPGPSYVPDEQPGPSYVADDRAPAHCMCMMSSPAHCMCLMSSPAHRMCLHQCQSRRQKEDLAVRKAWMRKA